MDLDKYQEWTVTEEGGGHAVLKWASPPETRDDDCVRRLDAPGLALVDDTPRDDGYDPYNSGMFTRNGSRSYDRGHGKCEAFARRHGHRRRRR